MNIQTYTKLSNYIPPKGYSEVDIVLDEDGLWDVAEKLVFLCIEAVLLKVLPNWLLGKEEKVL